MRINRSRVGNRRELGVRENSTSGSASNRQVILASNSVSVGSYVLARGARGDEDSVGGRALEFDGERVG